MISKLFVVSSILAAAYANPTPPASQCNTAPVQCCNSSGAASDPAIAKELALLGIVVQDVNAIVGVTCSPISVVGAGSGAVCNAEPLCCENNSFHGVVAIGCTPVNINA